MLGVWGEIAQSLIKFDRTGEQPLTRGDDVPSFWLDSHADWLCSLG
jgi:hypothetical protein